MDSRLRRFPPDRASAIPRGQGVQTTSCFPHLAHRSAAAHKLHSPLPRGGKNNKLKAPRLHPKRAPKNQSKSGYRKAQNEHLSWLHYGRSWVAPLGRSVTLGFDINAARIAELRRGADSTLEVSPADLAAARSLRFSDDEADLKACSMFMVTVPTPVDQANRPDMTPLVKASETVGRPSSTRSAVSP